MEFVFDFVATIISILVFAISPLLQFWSRFVLCAHLQPRAKASHLFPTTEILSYTLAPTAMFRKALLERADKGEFEVQIVDMSEGYPKTLTVQEALQKEKETKGPHLFKSLIANQKAHKFLEKAFKIPSIRMYV